MWQRHPREGSKDLREGLERRLGRPLSRREFLRASAGAAVAMPTMSAILAACGKNPRAQTTPGFQVATPDHPVKLPLVGQPIADGLQPESGATLQIYNWDQYLWKHVVQEFCDQYKCDFKITTFNNMEEAVTKMQTGELKLDVFFPTYDVLGKLVDGKFLQPLNHSYIPNLEANAWDMFKNPFYDQGWQYSVPYTVYTTGIAYRRDYIHDDQIFGADNPRAMLWDPQYSGKVGVYDSYRDTIGFALQKEGINDVNTEKSADIDKAKAALLELISAVNVRVEINGAYAKLPKGEYVLHESWSGDIVAGWGYVPKYVEADYEALGYWFPDDRIGPADNDLIAVPSNAEHPVLAHLFLNFMLDFKNAMDNFSWVGYQPPQKQADVNALTTTEGLYSKISNWAAPAMYVPPWMPAAVVRESDLTTTGLRVHELSPAGDTLWQNAWQEFKAGA
ncbi:MAG: spermidine/putrescine ABC transporter substrate-binding protein [Actinobacteria bacterium]|nr:spermidine/putrescine ABC transporter substrate-binding protein [Actinomycetota bacterium]